MEVGAFKNAGVAREVLVEGQADKADGIFAGWGAEDDRSVIEQVDSRATYRRVLHDMLNK